MTTYTKLAEELFVLKTREYANGFSAKDSLASTGEDGVLYRLYTGDREGLLVGEIAHSMHLTSGRIANILKRLEAKLYVRRLPVDSDRRHVLVVLTEEGERHIGKVYQENIRVLEWQLRMLGEEDAREYIRILTKLVEGTAGAKGSGPIGEEWEGQP